MTLTIFILVSILVSGSMAKDCMSDMSHKCLSSTDSGAAGYFNYFKWKGGDPCFLYNGKRMCLTSTTTGMLETCTCTAECGCSGVVPVVPITCNSASTNQFDKCLNLDTIKTSYCPLTKINSKGEIVQNTACSLCGTKNEACFNSVCQSGILVQADKDLIVKIHNEFRSKVALGLETRGVGGGQPPAADMNELKWDDDLAFMAQLWSNQCPTNHNSDPLVPSFPKYVGENMADSWNSVLQADRDYKTPITAWYDEVAHFPPQNVGKFSQDKATGTIGHYTALVWGKTTRVGCGFIMYKDPKTLAYPYRKTLVCNYGPGGNMLGAPVYTAGPTGSKCPAGVRNGLCI